MDLIRVILVDDHSLPRAGIRSLVENLPGIEVVAEAANGREALELIRRHPPQVVVTDISMPVMGGFELTERVCQEFPASHVLILSMHTPREYVWRAMHAGAKGYLSKDAPPPELEEAIRTVAGGRWYLSPRLVSTLPGPLLPNPLELLTPRQLDVFKLLARGKSNKEIAKILNVGTKTVETHRAEVLRRLNARTVADLVLIAVRFGLVSPEEGGAASL